MPGVIRPQRGVAPKSGDLGVGYTGVEMPRRQEHARPPHCACAGRTGQRPPSQRPVALPAGPDGQAAVGADLAGYTSNRSPQASHPRACSPASCLKYLKPGRPPRPSPQFSPAHARSCGLSFQLSFRSAHRSELRSLGGSEASESAHAPQTGAEAVRTREAGDVYLLAALQVT